MSQRKWINNSARRIVHTAKRAAVAESEEKIVCFHHIFRAIVREAPLLISAALDVLEVPRGELGSCMDRTAGPADLPEVDEAEVLRLSRDAQVILLRVKNLAECLPGSDPRITQDHLWQATCECIAILSDWLLPQGWQPSWIDGLADLAAHDYREGVSLPRVMV